MEQSKELIYLITFACHNFVELSSVFDESPDGLLEELHTYDFTPGDVSTYRTLYNRNRIVDCL